MANRSFTRLSNAFPRSLKSRSHVAPSTVWYNFIRVHETLKMSPAMDALRRSRESAALQNESRRLMPIKDSNGRAA